METTAEKVTENNLEIQSLEIVKIEFLPESFDEKKGRLQMIAEEISKIEADPAKMDKDTLELVNSTKNKIVKARTNIQAQGKALRDPHTEYNKKVKEYENELIAILEPEELRLKSLEVNAKQVAIRAERMKTLPEFLEKLASIGDHIGIDTEEQIKEYNEMLLGLDPNQRDTYYNDRRAAYFDAKEAEAKEVEAAAAEARASEQKKIDDDKAEIEREKVRLATEKKNGRIQRLLTLGLKDTGNVYEYEGCIFSKANFETEDEKFETFMNEATEYVQGKKEELAAAAEAAADLKIKAAEEAATKAAEDKAAEDVKEKEFQAEQSRAAEVETKRQEEEDAEIERQAEAAAAKKAKEDREAKEAYQQWLVEMSYNEKTDEIVQMNGVARLLRIVGTYDHNQVVVDSPV